MGRNKFRESQKTKSHHHHQQRAPKTKSATIVRRQHSQIKQQHLAQKQSPSRSKGKNASQSQRPPRVPFLESDRVLLVGEGDFSFALSLVRNYNVASVTATSYDDEKTLLGKYPTIHTNIHKLQSHTQAVNGGGESTLEWEGFSDEEGSEHSESHHDGKEGAQVSVLYGIDATKLSSAHKKIMTRHAPFTKIVFNFPHTGGLSTDVNRQVRANQELLVSFFNAAKPLLLPTKKSHATRYNDKSQDDEHNNDNDNAPTSDPTSKRGCILVTLFEREPYSLWNIRDLARYCGLEVVESFKFPWAAYPGYQHARTVGDITTGVDRSEEGKRKGAWRGEERDARCYVFGLKADSSVGISSPQRTQKKKKGDRNSDDNSD